MKKIIYGFLFLSAALMAVSCGTSTDKEILKYTTDKTLAIVKVNVAQLEKKLPKDEILKEQSAKMSKEDKEKLQLVMDAKNNGIDTEKPFYMMADIEGDGFAFSFVAWINDKAKFEAGFSKITEKKIKVNDKNLVYADEQLIGSIKDDMIIFSGGATNPMGGMVPSAPRGKQVEAEFYTGFWSRKGTENKAKIEQVEKSLGNDADISTWINLYGIINTASKGYIETLAINKQLVDAGFGFNLNFGEGKIDIKGSTFFNEELQKLVKKYYDGREIDYGIVKTIDLDTANGYSIGNVSFDFLRHFIKEAGLEPMANNALQYMGLTLDDITGGLKGTYAFVNYKEIPAEVKPEEAGADVAMDAQGEPVPVAPVVEGEEGYEGYEDPYANPYAAYHMPQPNVLVALGINGDKAKKLVSFISENPMFSNYVKVYSDKEILAISTTDKGLEGIKSGKAAANKSLKKQTGITGYGWTNGDSFNPLLAQSKSKVKISNIETTSKIKDGNATSEIVITLDKNKKNALYYILGYE